MFAVQNERGQIIKPNLSETDVQWWQNEIKRIPEWRTYRVIEVGSLTPPQCIVLEDIATLAAESMAQQFCFYCRYPAAETDQQRKTRVSKLTTGYLAGVGCLYKCRKHQIDYDEAKLKEAGTVR